MKIAIIGAGFTGLTAAYRLLEKGHQVTVFEKDSHPGGLAIGYKEKEWRWSLEQHYHHWFTNDTAILSLAREIHHPVVIKRPKTSVYLESKIYQLDRPSKILSFSQLSLHQRLRMAAVLAFLRFNPFWRPLEKVHAATALPKLMGKHAYQVLWEPQLKNKMGDFAKVVSLVWFWARIYKRTSSLAYPENGFLSFANALSNAIEKRGGNIFFNRPIETIRGENGSVALTMSSGGKTITRQFDKVIVTLPSPLFIKIAPQLPDTYRKKFAARQSLGATNLVLRLKKPFLKDGTYWLSICETPSPVMVLVEHTNFMNKNYYNNEHILYVGNYTPINSRLYSLTPEQTLDCYDPLLRKINPDYKKNIIGYSLFKAPFAQPIIPVNYYQHIPDFITPIPNVFLANIEQVYPWDRGTNYAVELGEKIAKIVTK